MNKKNIELVITINSLLPKGFIGWPLIAYSLLKKYNGKVYVNKSKDSDIIKGELINKYKEISYSDIIDSLDFENPNLIFISLEPSSESSIPSIKGRVYSAICGPRSLNWLKQVKICSTKKVDGIFSELLPDEIDNSISQFEFNFFYDKSIFLPPKLDIDLNSTNNLKDDTLLIHDTNISNDKDYAFLNNSINVLKKSNIHLISLSDYYDFNDLIFNLINYHHIYNIISYPQLNLLIAFYNQSKISHTNASADSVNRYIPFNIYNKLLINYKSPRTKSLRISLSNILRPKSNNNSENVDTVYIPSLSNLTLVVEIFTGIINSKKITEIINANESNDNILITQLNNKLDNIDYLYKEFKFKILFEPSNLYIFCKNIQSKQLRYCINPNFIRYLSNQKYNYHIQNIFNLLFDIDHNMTLDTCLKNSEFNQNALFKLIFLNFFY